MLSYRKDRDQETFQHFAHKLWKTMCANGALATQVLDFIGDGTASLNFRQPRRLRGIRLLGAAPGTYGRACGIVLPSTRWPGRLEPCAFLHRFCGKDCEQAGTGEAKSLIVKEKIRMRLFWAWSFSTRQAVHTNCGKQCEQGPAIRSKLLIPLRKVLHDRFLSRFYAGKRLSTSSQFLWIRLWPSTLSASEVLDL